MSDLIARRVWLCTVQESEIPRWDRDVRPRPWINYNVKECQSCGDYLHLHVVVWNEIPVKRHHLAHAVRLPAECISNQTPLGLSDTLQFGRLCAYGSDKNEQKKKSRLPLAEDITNFWAANPEAKEIDVYRKFPIIGVNTSMRKLIYNCRPKPAPLKHKRNGIWLWGQTDFGKSSMIRAVVEEMKLDMFCQPVGEDYKWWDHYDQEKVVMMNEMTSECRCPMNIMKQLVDIDPIQVQVKGACVYFRPRITVVTTNAPPWDIYHDHYQCDKEALYSRFSVFNVKQKWGMPQYVDTQVEVTKLFHTLMGLDDIPIPDHVRSIFVPPVQTALSALRAENCTVYGGMVEAAIEVVENPANYSTEEEEQED